VRCTATLQVLKTCRVRRCASCTTRWTASSGNCPRSWCLSWLAATSSATRRSLRTSSSRCCYRCRGVTERSSTANFEVVVVAPAAQSPKILRAPAALSRAVLVCMFVFVTASERQCGNYNLKSYRRCNNIVSYEITWIHKT